LYRKNFFITYNLKKFIFMKPSFIYNEKCSFYRVDEHFTAQLNCIGKIKRET
jgi:hypothetical protein